jgi:hypothetical protein
MPGKVIIASNAWRRPASVPLLRNRSTSWLSMKLGIQRGLRIQLGRAPYAPTEVRRGTAARQHVGQRAVERKVQHPGQRRTLRIAHVTLDLAHLRVEPRLVDAEALPEHEELLAPGGLRHAQHAGASGSFACKKSRSMSCGT